MKWGQIIVIGASSEILFIFPQPLSQLIESPNPIYKSNKIENVAWAGKPYVSFFYLSRSRLWPVFMTSFNVIMEVLIGFQRSCFVQESSLRSNNKKFNFKFRRWKIFEEVWGNVGWKIKRWLNEAIIGMGGLYQVPTLRDILIFIIGDKDRLIWSRSGFIWNEEETVAKDWLWQIGLSDWWYYNPVLRLIWGGGLSRLKH